MKWTALALGVIGIGGIGLWLTSYGLTVTAPRKATPTQIEVQPTIDMPRPPIPIGRPPAQIASPVTTSANEAVGGSARD